MEFRAAIQSYFDNVLTAVDTSVAEDILNPEVRCSLPHGEISIGIDRILDSVAYSSTAFPHKGIEINHFIVDGSRAAVMYTLEMKHTGKYADYEATGKTVKLSGVNVFQFDGSRICSIDVFFNPDLVTQQIS